MAWTTLGTVAPGDVLRANSGTAAYNNIIGNVTDIRAAQINVQSVTKTDTFSASTASNTETAAITGLSVTITPSSATSKVLLIASLALNATVLSFPAWVAINVYRGATQVGSGAAAGSRTRAIRPGLVGVASVSPETAFSHLDEPGVATAITYDIKLRNLSGSTQTLYLNRGTDDSDTYQFLRSASTLTAIEVPV